MAAEFALAVLEVVPLYSVPSSLDGEVLTVRAVCVFRFVSGNISDIDVIDPFFARYSASLLQCRLGCRRQIFQQVHGLKP